jgi:hypothetical protein
LQESDKSYWDWNKGCESGEYKLQKLLLIQKFYKNHKKMLNFIKFNKILQNLWFLPSSVIFGAFLAFLWLYNGQFHTPNLL